MKNCIIKWCLKMLQRKSSIFFMCVCDDGEAFIGLQGRKEVLDTFLQELMKNGADVKEWFIDGVVQHLDKYQSEKKIFMEKLNNAERDTQ